MLRRRAIVAAALTLTTAVVTSLPSAEAAVPGIGTSSGGSEVLHLNIGGGVLDLRLLDERSSTTTESEPGAAVERVVPLTVSSSLVPALGAVSTPPIEVASDGAEQSQTAPGADLGGVTGGAGLPAVLSGTIDPTTLRAVVDAAGAVAAAAGGATDLGVLGGVLQVGRIDALLGSSADPAAAGAGRGLSIDSIEILDLGAVLSLLGLSPADLPLDVLAGLLDSLGLPLPGGAVSVDALVDTVEGLIDQAGSVPDQIDALTAQLAPLEAQLATIQGVLAGGCTLVEEVLLAPLGLTCATATGGAASLTSQISSVTAQIDALVDTVLDLLQPVFDIVDGLLAGIDDAPLVAIEDLVVGVTAEAAETLELSTADVLASVGAVRVGTFAVPGVDALGTIDQLAALGDQLTGAVGSVLSIIDPSLAGLVDIGLFERTTSVRTEDGKSVAEALVSGLTVDITPPDLCGLLGDLGVAETVGGLLGSLGQSLPALPAPVGDVLGDLGSVLDCAPSAQLVGGVATALTDPLSLEVLTVAGRGAFVAVPTQVPPTTATPTTPGSTPALPRTGTEDIVLIALGCLAAATALGMRKALRASR